MGHSRTSTVGEALEQQLTIIGRPEVSLHSLWRAADRPPRRDPRSWACLAAPLIAGLARYLAAIEPDGRELLRYWDGEDGEPWRAGDLMAHEVLARVYAEFLTAAAAGACRSVAARTS